MQFLQCLKNEASVSFLITSFSWCSFNSFFASLFPRVHRGHQPRTWTSQWHPDLKWMKKESHDTCHIKYWKYHQYKWNQIATNCGTMESTTVDYCGYWTAFWKLQVPQPEFHGSCWSCANPEEATGDSTSKTLCSKSVQVMIPCGIGH